VLLNVAEASTRSEITEDSEYSLHQLHHSHPGYDPSILLDKMKTVYTRWAMIVDTRSIGSVFQIESEKNMRYFEVGSREAPCGVGTCRGRS
jgi:hypothetical protein